MQGRDAGKLLNFLSTNQVDGDSEMITYTQWLNREGNLEADLTVIKCNDEKFIVVATDTMHRHVETWMKRHIDPNDNVYVTDVTSGYAHQCPRATLSRTFTGHHQ